MSSSAPAAAPAHAAAAPAPGGGAVGASKAAEASTSIDTEQQRHIDKHLRSLLASVQKREPLDASYDQLLPVSYRKYAKACTTIHKADKDGKTPTKGGKKPVMTADVKLHRRLNANLRDIVETYASTPAGWRRKPNTRRIDLDFGSKDSADTAKSEEIDAQLRAAFALRESKEHEQRDLVNATLKAENAKLRRGWGFSQVAGVGAGGAGVGGMAGGAAPGMLPPLEEASARKKRLDGIAKQLREKEKGAADRAKWHKIAQKGKGLILHPKAAEKKILAEYQPPDTPGPVKINTTTPAQSDEAKKRKRLDPEEQRQLEVEEAKQREKVLRERIQREEDEHRLQLEKEREEQERKERALETPRDALHRLYEPIFQALWDMEFADLGGTNPFRMVISRENCASLGVPNYCDVIAKPMNLTYVQEKVNARAYESLQEFLEDIDLIAKNAMQFNHQPDNPYHIAAKAFRKQFRKLAKPLVQSLTKGMAAK
ncbi:hypothetical protein ACHAXT_000798 [Thalassiosira profunda]